MKVCGIELKGNDAILCCLEGDASAYQLILTDRKKISVKDSLDQTSIRSFFHEISSFFDENQFDSIGIKARATKGRFSGGSVSFKMEALIQNTNASVKIINGATIKAKLKSKLDSIDFSQLNSYQKEAMMVAIYRLEN